MERIPSDTIKRNLLLAAIIFLAVILAWQMYPFIPGILGAITLYILMRQHYFELTVVRNWKKWLAAAVFILLALLIFVLPVLILVQMLMPKLSHLAHNPSQLSGGLNVILERLARLMPMLRLSSEELRALMQQATSSLPTILTATAGVLGNLVLAFFLLYFMLIDGRKMERRIQRFLPLKDDNIDQIWEATRIMVVSNAIGIPVLAACQALAATLGYYVFGVEEALLWGVVTGVFSLLPVLGTAIIWAPLCIYLFATGHTASGVGLLIYSVIIITNIDNVLRFTLLKKLGDVHPIITVLGIIVGIPLFGFMGLIFGPLLISYLMLLVQIYRVETSPAAGNNNGT